MLHHSLGLIDRAAAHLSTGQTIALGGAGSAAAITAAMAVTPSWAVWLQVATFAVGLLSGLGGLVLVAMKAIQQRREMRHWAKKNPW